MIDRGGIGLACAHRAGLSGKAKWIGHVSAQDMGIVDFDANLSKAPDAVAYAFTEFTSDRDQDVTPFVVTAPFSILPGAGFEHLVGVEVSILAQYRVGQCGDQRIGRMAEGKVAGDETAGIAY